MINALRLEKSAAIQSAHRIVVKLGSRVLVQRNGRPDERQIRHLVQQIAQLRTEGCDVIVVSSGAIASGMEALSLKKRPRDIAGMQMAAAVGQVRLMSRYERLFAAKRLRVAQILLTHEDLRDRTRHLNARNTILNLLREGVIPIVNENDVVASEEIKFGDNDLLASLVSLLIDADLLVLLSTADGVRAPVKSGKTSRIPFLSAISEETLALAWGKGSELSTGGMLSKLQSAQMFTSVGGWVAIASGRKPNALSRLMQGEDIGTLIEGRARSLSKRKRWIAFFHHSRGSVVIDQGAAVALQNMARSLLPIGIKEVQGSFPRGAVINIKDSRQQLIARGLTNYSSDELQEIQGKRTAEIASVLGHLEQPEAVHYDNLVVF